MEIGASAGGIEIEKVAALFEAHALRGKIGGLDVFCLRAFFFTILQRGEAVAVQRGVDVNRIGVERLANHQHAFAMRIAAEAVESNLGADADVARHFFPGELEFVFGHPHVVAAAGDRVGFRAWRRIRSCRDEEPCRRRRELQKFRPGRRLRRRAHWRARFGTCVQQWQPPTDCTLCYKRNHSSESESHSFSHFCDSGRLKPRLTIAYGITLIITTPCDGTEASYLPVILPRSLCDQRSRTLAVRCAG